RPSANLQRASTEAEAREVAPHVRAPAATAEDREHILRTLYAMRSELTRAKRLGSAAAHDDSRLEEINAYIDYWEADVPTKANDVWARLEAIVPELLSIKASLSK